MKSKSAKAKGSRFEKYLLDKLRISVEAGAYHPKGSGAGEEKGDIVLPSKRITIEAKNQKNLSILDWWEQAQAECLDDNDPVLMFRNPRKAEFKETLVVIDIEHFIELVTQSGGTVEETLSFSQRSALDSLKVAANRVRKEFQFE